MLKIKTLSMLLCLLLAIWLFGYLAIWLFGYLAIWQNKKLFGYFQGN